MEPQGATTTHQRTGSNVIPRNTWIDLCTTPMFKPTIRSHCLSRTTCGALAEPSKCWTKVLYMRSNLWSMRENTSAMASICSAACNHQYQITDTKSPIPNRQKAPVLWRSLQKEVYQTLLDVEITILVMFITILYTVMFYINFVAWQWSWRSCSRRAWPLPDHLQVPQWVASAQNLCLSCCWWPISKWLIVDATLEACGAPIHELDGTLGLDGGHCSVHILWHNIT